ncbi:MAG TPA: hypothetical protein VGJ26_17265, partial [Pirellulales bacterium]
MSRVFIIISLSCSGLLLCSVSGCSKAPALNPTPDVTLAATLRKGGTAGATAEAGPVSTGTGWGTIKGRFVYAGDPPKYAPLPVTKDQNVCGNSKPDQSLIV